jgi:hypothetical protein
MVNNILRRGPFCQCIQDNGNIDAGPANTGFTSAYGRVNRLCWSNSSSIITYLPSIQYLCWASRGSAQSTGLATGGWRLFFTVGFYQTIRQPAVQGHMGVATEKLSASRRRRKETGIWQRRFWEHAICDPRRFQPACGLHPLELRKTWARSAGRRVAVFDVSPVRSTGHLSTRLGWRRGRGFRCIRFRRISRGKVRRAHHPR